MCVVCQIYRVISRWFRIVQRLAQHLALSYCTTSCYFLLHNILLFVIAQRLALHSLLSLRAIESLSGRVLLSTVHSPQEGVSHVTWHTSHLCLALPSLLFVRGHMVYSKEICIMAYVICGADVLTTVCSWREDTWYGTYPDKCLHDIPYVIPPALHSVRFKSLHSLLNWRGYVIDDIWYWHSICNISYDRWYMICYRCYVKCFVARLSSPLTCWDTWYETCIMYTWHTSSVLLSYTQSIWWRTLTYTRSPIPSLYHDHVSIYFWMSTVLSLDVFCCARSIRVCTCRM